MTVTIKITNSQTSGTFPSIATPGQLFVNTADGYLFVWTGANWVNITLTGTPGTAGSGSPGPIGPTGPVGPTGTGPVGPPGPPG